MKSFLAFITALLIILDLRGQSSTSIMIDNVERTFTYFVPNNLPGSDVVPLVFVLHGTTQTGNGIMEISHFNEIATSNQFIVVYPDGIGNAWNVGLGAAGSTADDLSFIGQLIDWFDANYPIDIMRVFSCGFSAGGYMSYKLACSSAHCFAAVASVSGTMNQEMENACSPLYNTSVMCIHGTNDFVVSYNGSAISGYSVEQVLDFWSSELACDQVQNIQTLPNLSVLDLSTVERHEFPNCSNGSELVLLKIIGGGHQWPGTDALLGGIGTINQDINASAEIWDFFSDKNCSNTLSIAVSEEREFEIYPNPAENMLTITNFEGRKFTIFDVSGKPILTGKYVAPIDISILQRGVYVFQSDSGTTEKLVIQ